MEATLRTDVRHSMRKVLMSVDQLKEVPDQVTVRALNRTATGARATSVRQIRERYNIKARVARDQIKLERARRGHLRATLQVSGRRIPLIEFAARPTRRGVTVRVKQDRKLVRHAFVATMPSGHKGVFIRQGKDRLPIEELYSISLPKAFTHKTVLAALNRMVRERFPKEFEHELRYHLNRIRNG